MISRRFTFAFGLLLAVSSSTHAAEPWADSRLTVRDGLELWLDAGRQTEARATRNLPALKTDADVDTWLDGSGNERHLRQQISAARPKLVRLGETPLMRFDGIDDHLRATGEPAELKSWTVFLVAVPRSNLGGFRGLIAFNAKDQRDWMSGMTVMSAASVLSGRTERWTAIGSKNWLQLLS